MAIFSEYQELATTVETFENQKYTIRDAYRTISNLQFDQDSCEVKKYIKARLQNPEKTDIHEIMDPSRKDITPAAYSLPQNAQPTTASVEISLSMLNNILAKDRNFSPENVHKYIVLSVHYNSAIGP